MKKIIITSLLSLFTILLTAQQTKFGIKGGLNIANQSDNYISNLVQTNNSSIIGFNLGAFVESEISDKFSIQPEVLFSVQGNKYAYNVFVRVDAATLGEYVNTQIVNNLFYLNIPVTIKYYIVEKISLEIGPQFGLLLSSKSKSSSFFQTLGNVNSSYSDGYKSIDYGINLGAGYNITEKISTGIRYNFGLNNVNGRSSTEIKNSNLSISMSYRL